MRQRAEIAQLCVFFVVARGGMSPLRKRASAHLHSPKISVRLRVGTPPPSIVSMVSAPVLMLMLSLRCGVRGEDRSALDSVSGESTKKNRRGEKKKKAGKGRGGAGEVEGGFVAHHDDPLPGRDECASLNGGQKLARRLEHLVDLGVGHALDLDEGLLGHSQQALHRGEARVLHFLREFS